MRHDDPENYDDENEMTSEEMKAAENRKLWEDKQQQRWEQWLSEEIDRLNDKN